MLFQVKDLELVSVDHFHNETDYQGLTLNQKKFEDPGRNVEWEMVNEESDKDRAKSSCQREILVV